MSRVSVVNRPLLVTIYASSMIERERKTDVLNRASQQRYHDKHPAISGRYIQRKNSAPDTRPGHPTLTVLLRSTNLRGVGKRWGDKMKWFLPTLRTKRPRDSFLTVTDDVTSQMSTTLSWHVLSIMWLIHLFCSRHDKHGHIGKWVELRSLTKASSALRTFPRSWKAYTCFCVDIRIGIKLKKISVTLSLSSSPRIVLQKTLMWVDTPFCLPVATNRFRKAVLETLVQLAPDNVFVCIFNLPSTVSTSHRG